MSALEPRIVFGAFDMNGRALQPGMSSNAVIGYGILDLPPGLSANIAQSPDDHYLQEYLKQAHKAIETEALVARFEAFENKLELLVGSQIVDFYFYSDEVYFRVKTPVSQERYEFTLLYGSNQVCFGNHSRKEIADELYRRMPVEVTSVEKDLFTLSSGFQFALTPRFRDEQPTLRLSNHGKADLIRSLDMRAAERDSATVQ